MTQHDTVEVEISESLVEEAEECAEERGFRDLQDFVEGAILDAINAESDLTEEAREEIEEVRGVYEEGEEDPLSLEEVFEELVDEE